MLDLLTRVIDNLPDMAVIVFDWDHRYHICRGPLHERLGYHRAKMEGKTIYEVLSPASCDLLVPLYERTLHGEDFTVEFNGTELHDLTFWVNFVPIREDGQVKMGMAIVKDVTTEKRLIEKRASEKHKAFADSFFDKIGTSIMAHVGILSETCRTPEGMKSANNILKTITNMRKRAHSESNTV